MLLAKHMGEPIRPIDASLVVTESRRWLFLSSCCREFLSQSVGIGTERRRRRREMRERQSAVQLGMPCFGFVNVAGATRDEYMSNN